MPFKWVPLNGESFGWHTLILRGRCGGTHEYKSEVTEVRPFIRWWCCRGHLFHYPTTLVVQNKFECFRSENLGNTERIILCCRWQKIDNNLEWNYTFPAPLCFNSLRSGTCERTLVHATGSSRCPPVAVWCGVGKCQRNGHYSSLSLFKRFNLVLSSNMSCDCVLVRPFCCGKFSCCGPRDAINAYRLIPICNCRELPWIWVKIIGYMQSVYWWRLCQNMVMIGPILILQRT